MLINKAIAKLMKDNGITQQRMATMIGKGKATDISARLNYPNMSFSKAIEMLSAMGYEVVVQKTTAGVRGKDQIVIERGEE